MTNERGQTVGGSENGLLDPLTGFPAFRGVLWQQGKIIDLGTFGGNNSLAVSINNRGQVVGGAQNAIPDSFAFCGQPFLQFYPTQVHAFSWQEGKCAIWVRWAAMIAVPSTSTTRGRCLVTRTQTQSPTPTPEFQLKTRSFGNVGR